MFGSEMSPSARQSIVITGGSAGVGRAIALQFARKGARVAVIGRSKKGLESVKHEMEILGSEALVFPLDVSNGSAVEAAADSVAQRWGGIDIWINNAMVTMFAALSQMSQEEFRRI